MPEFSLFDSRHYKTVPVREGYRDWTPTYEQAVEDAMDLALLERVASVPWREEAHVVQTTSRKVAAQAAANVGVLAGLHDDLGTEDQDQPDAAEKRRQEASDWQQ